MLTQLSIVKARLAITGTADDAMLNRMIDAISARFERFCNRSFGRQVDTCEEFGADAVEIATASYPIETVSRFEIKDNEATGWQEIASPPDYWVRRACVISLSLRLGTCRQWARVIYTGGYVLPGDEIKPGQTPLPEDIQEACVEQLACWYLNRTKLGLLSVTDGSLTTAYAQQELLPSVQSTLRRHVRFQ